MNRARSAVALRWVLPLAQLLVCLVIVLPVRWFVAFEVYRSIEPVQSSDGTVRLSQAELEAIEKAGDFRNRLMKVPIVLDFPVVLLEAPYTLAVYAGSGHPVGGAKLEKWRALGWPFLGVPFWWCIGRAIEALLAARKALVLPRITLIETLFGVVLACIGIASLVGVLTGTPDDKHDVDFFIFVGGGLFWGILGAASIAARIVQWRIMRRTKVVQQLA